MSFDTALVVGLGNPGPGYAGNRHNAGALVVDLLADRIGGRFKVHKSVADVADGRLGATRVVLVKPRSYMNLSGGPTATVARYFGIEPAGVVVVHDELDLDYGTIRLKFGGGEGGHNGLKSITGSLGTRDYHRVRFGVSRPPGRQDPADYVLKDFSAAERKTLALELDAAADATELLLELGLTDAQNKLH